MTNELGAFNDQLRLPIVAVPTIPMSGPDLAIATCRTETTGSFATLTARASEQLETWFQQICYAESVAPAYGAAFALLRRASVAAAQRRSCIWAHK